MSCRPANASASARHSPAPAPEQCRAITRPGRGGRGGCFISTFMDGAPCPNCSVPAAAGVLSEFAPDDAGNFRARDTHILERAVAQRPKMRDRCLLHAPGE